jgi:transposase
MNIHKKARLTPIGRERLVEAMLGGQTPKAAVRAAGVCPKTARKWIDRFKMEGRAGLMDRSSRPKRLHRPTPDAIVRQIEWLLPTSDGPADRSRSRRFAGLC